MKFGVTLDGVWTVIGILDAWVGQPREPLAMNELLDNVAKAMTFLRDTVGRPKNHWGLTPIAIYKPIVGVAETEAAASAVEPPPE
jgi:hypothetical protein